MWRDYFPLGEIQPGSPGTSVELAKSLIDAVNLEPGLVAAVHAYERIAFIQKSSS